MRSIFSAALTFALLLTSPLPAAEIDLIYWSDMLAQNTAGAVEIDSEMVPLGGAPLMKGMLKSLQPKKEQILLESFLKVLLKPSRPEESRVLVIDAGNNFAGSPVSTLTKGRSQVEILNRLGVDVFVPGAREFTYGWKSLVNVSHKAHYTTLLANVIDNRPGTNLFPGAALFRRNGVNVAVIGFISPRFRHGLIRDGVLGLEQKDIREEARQFVKTFTDSADVLLAVTNVGWAGDSLLAADVPGLDVIIGGSDLTAFDPPRQVNETLIMQAGSQSRKLGRLTLQVDTAEHEVIHFDAAMYDLKPGVVEPDAGLRRFVNRLERKYTHKLDHEIGRLAVDWNLNPRGPCNLAQWVADATHSFAPSSNLALINNGSLKKGLKAGLITEKDLWEICPAENPIIIIQISGPELFYIIEHQLQAVNDFLTWSGLQLVVEDGEIKSITVNDAPVTEFDEFSVVTTGLLWDNWGYIVGTNPGREIRPSFYMPGNQREILIEAVKSQKVVSKPLDRRWSVED